MTIHSRRAAALLCAGALSLTTLGAAPAVATQPGDNQSGPAGPAASWLATQLTDGVIHNTAWDFDDLGMTLDIGLSMDEVGGDRALVRQIRSTMSGRLAEYVTGGTYGDPQFRLAGELAKALVFAQATGADPGTYGGFDLVAELEQRVIGSGPSAGRIENLSPAPGWDDYANVFSQALAVRGLSAAGSTGAPAVTDFLLQQQCASGYFRVFFNPDKAAATQGCQEGAPDSGSDTDATAAALSALARVTPRTPRIQAALDRGTSWLAATQGPDGAFTGSATTPEANSNSTGLAAAALAAGGRCEAAGRAAEWVTSVQVGPQASGSPLAGEEGAIAYTPGLLEQARTSGIGAGRDTWWRATVQATAGLAHRLGSTRALSVRRLTDASAPGLTLWASGLVPGERYCLSGPGVVGTRSIRVAADGTLSAAVPAATPGQPGWTIVGRDGRVTVDAAAPLSSVAGVSLAAPRGFQRAGARIPLEVLGARAGDRFEVSGSGMAPQRVVVGSDASAATLVRLPATTGVWRYTLAGADGSTTVDVDVLGRARLRVKVRNARTGSPRVVVTGLAAREPASIRVGKRIVWRGRADTRGRVVRRLALPVGVTKVRVVGQYADRFGSVRVRTRH